jgi:hypothetical protein
VRRGDHGKAVRHDEDRVAVGRRLRRHLHADEAARSALVLDHERLAEVLLQLGRDRARDDVAAAAGREGHDDLHGLAG